MRILFLIDSLAKGGRERRLIELIKGLLDKGDVEMELILFSKTIDYPEIHDLAIPLHILERKPKKDPRVFYRVYKIAKTFQPDILHTWSSMAAIFAYPAKKLLNIKLINGNIADAPVNLKIWKKQLLRAKLTFPFSDVVIANCKAGLKAYKAPKHKSICIYNGFDLNRINHLKDKTTVRKIFYIKTPFVVGMVAAFTDRKDYFTFLDAAVRITEKRKDVSFIAVGDGPNLDKCKQLIPQALLDRIIFTGSRFDVESIVNVFDIGVLSTNVDIHGEGISNSIMEYMVLSKPVVATRGGGTDEIVLDGETGYRINAKSPEQMAEKILFLLDHPNIAIEMGEKGRKRIIESFNLTKMAAIYYNLYKKNISMARNNDKSYLSVRKIG